MMRYFELEDYVSMPGRWCVGEILFPDGTEPLLNGGLRLDDPRPLRAEVYHIGRVLDFSRTSFAVPIAKRGLANAIKVVAHSDVQCIPVRIPGKKGMVVLNVVRVIRCVDEQRSKFVKWTIHDHRADLAGQYHYFDELVLDTSAIPPDAHFFRIKDSLIELVVSEAVKDAMEMVGCFGAKFIELKMT